MKAWLSTAAFLLVLTQPLTASRILVDGRNAIQPEAATRAMADKWLELSKA